MRRKKILIGIGILACILVVRHNIISVSKDNARKGKRATIQEVSSLRIGEAINEVEHLLEISTPFGSLTVL